MTTTPLSQRMLDAADILEEFNREYADMYNLDAPWRPSELRREAGHRKAEEEEAAERLKAECPQCHCERWVSSQREAELWERHHPCGGGE